MVAHGDFLGQETDPVIPPLQLAGCAPTIKYPILLLE
jgi:hypothetical protein